MLVILLLWHDSLHIYCTTNYINIRFADGVNRRYILRLLFLICKRRGSTRSTIHMDQSGSRHINVQIHTITSAYVNQLSGTTN